jgi:hypothetical protein
VSLILLHLYLSALFKATNWHGCENIAQTALTVAIAVVPNGDRRLEAANTSSSPGRSPSSPDVRRRHASVSPVSSPQKEVPAPTTKTALQQLLALARSRCDSIFVEEAMRMVASELSKSNDTAALFEQIWRLVELSAAARQHGEVRQLFLSGQTTWLLQVTS